MAGIVGSPEFYGDAGSTPAGFLAAVYRDLLGRQVDDTGATAWSAAMASGLTHQAVASAVIASGEYEADEVAWWYQTYLRRPANAAEITSWVSLVHGGVTAAQGVVSPYSNQSDSPRSLPPRAFLLREGRRHRSPRTHSPHTFFIKTSPNCSIGLAIVQSV